ncbi:hypothetical protein E3V33_00965 [Candidatus Marinimicrobia bacterium MT.SAG.4]|nr:hypothetical protein E3V33_00965 [Candidatus Marinimicrobia bacterium MT.SAG.4]
MSFQDDQVFLEKYLDENLNTVLGLRLAEKYISSDNLEGAHLILTEFLESHPNNATAMFLMGEIAFKEGNNDKAKSHYEDTIQIDPTFVASYHRLVTISNDDGNEAEVTEIYRLLNLVNPMDKKAAEELEGKEKADASKTKVAERIQNKFQLSSAGEPSVSSDTDDEDEETAEDADSLADELSSKLDIEESVNLDKPLDEEEDETELIEEDIETEVSDSSEEDKESEEEVTSEDEPESTEVDAFGTPAGDDEVKTETPEEESEESTEEEEKPEEDVPGEDEPESTEVDAFGAPAGDDEVETETPEEESVEAVEEEESSIDVEKPYEEDTSVAEESDKISEGITRKMNLLMTNDEITMEESSTEENDSEESDEEADSEISTGSDEEESSDSDDSSEEVTPEKKIDETESKSSTESADENDTELEETVVDKENREFEMPPFSKETLADVTVSDEDEVKTEEEAEPGEEKTEEDSDENLEGGVESLNIPLESTVDAVSTDDDVVAEEKDTDEKTGDTDSGTEEKNILSDSIEKTDKEETETPSDYESWVEKDATPDSMTTGLGDSDESNKSTFEGLLSETEYSGEVDTMELPEESDSALTVDDDQDIEEKIDDIYSLAQIDDDEDVSPLQAWFLDRKNLQENEQNEEKVEKEENIESITEPKSVPFSGESDEETEILQNTEETESEEKWDKFVETAVEKKGEDGPKDSESASTDIDSELRNIFDEVETPNEDQEISEAGADAPDITGGVKLNSDLATFTLADIYINQSQFNEALSVLDLLEQKGEKLERVASMRDEIKVKIEARNK